jgi:hypothetical protein
MPRSRDFAYSTGAAPTGSEKFSNVIVGKPTNGFIGTGIPWIGGPDEDLGYCIAKWNVNPIWTSPLGVNSRVGFGRSFLKTERSFIDMVNNDYNQNFQVGSRADAYLSNNSIWSSYGNDGYYYKDLVFSFNATNSRSYGNDYGNYWKDLSGNGNDGQIINGAYWVQQFGGDFIFDGSDDRIVTGVGNLGDNATYEAVIYSTGNASTYNMFIGQYLPYIGALYADRIVYSDYINGGQTWFTTEPGTISTNKYHHVVCTRRFNAFNNTTYMEIWIDGIQQATSTAGGRRTAFYSPDNITIGEGANFNWHPFLGRIPMVRVYNDALDGNAIVQNYEYSKEKMFVIDGLTMYVDAGNLYSYPYPDELTTLYDLSENENSVRSCFVSKSKNGRFSLWSNGNNATTAKTDVLNNDFHTIEFLLMFKSSPSYPNGWTGGWEQFFSFRAGGSTDRSPGIWRWPSERRIHWQYDPNNTGVQIGKNSQFEEFDLNTYYHVVVTKNGGELTAYVNGDEVGNVGVSNPKTAGNSPVTFYNYYTSDLMEIQLCRIYNRPLTVPEIRMNLDSLTNRF